MSTEIYTSDRTGTAVQEPPRKRALSIPGAESGSTSKSPAYSAQSSKDTHDKDDHEAHESELRGHLMYVLGAVICLVISGGMRLLRPDQEDVATLWNMAAAILSGIPILLETIEGAGLKAAENSEFYINQFITLAVVACFVTGQYVTGSLVAIILMVGHVFEDRSMLGVNEAINSLLNLSRGHARRVDPDGNEEEVDAESLRAGDRIRIRPGDKIAADGVVRTGCSAVNQANITGESIPVEVCAGATVFGGTTNMTGLLEVDVVKAGNDTVLGRVKKIVAEAQSTRAPIVRLTEEYAQYYLPLILLIAGFVLFFTRDVQRAISVIIVSIPCTFILAGPTAMVAALATASRLGILVKSVLFFEAANDIDTVVFDKTGTLTTGRLQVLDILPRNGWSRERLLTFAAAVEGNSTHPIAQAIARATASDEKLSDSVRDISEEHGLGMCGRIGESRILIGRRTWLKGKGILLSSVENERPEYSAIEVAVDGQHAGTIYLCDTLRKESTQIKEQLQPLGIDRFIMLTGDRYGVAEAIAAQIGFTEFQSECLPEQKQKAIEVLKESGRNVLVVGDGVNDAPALASGHLSIAMGALGSDVAIQTADIALMSNDLNRVGQFIALSKQTLRIINQNILCGFIFSTVAIVFSSAGYISPMAASFVHEFGAFFVIFNSARLLKFEGSSSIPEPNYENNDIKHSVNA
jgi:Zn2+/Cd2+-exporting ATPase